MHKYIQTFCLFLLFTNTYAQIRTDTYEGRIIGDWKEIPSKQDHREDLPPPFVDKLLGFSFYADNNVEVKSGFFKKVVAKEEKDRKIKFLGTRTKYKVERGVLSIFSLASDAWINYQISGITNDTMILQNDNKQVLKFLKQHYSLEAAPKFDKIVLSTSGCFGSCPRMNILINSEGNVLFFGESFTLQTGIYVSGINPQLFDSLQNNFRKANLTHLASNFTVACTDLETVTTCFIKNDKIIKSVEDYGNSAPDELLWAYLPLKYLYQSIPLLKLPQHDLPDYLKIQFTGFKKKRQLINLTQADGFYLWDCLRRGKKVNVNFDDQYELTFKDISVLSSTSEGKGDDQKTKSAGVQIKKILTNGQYFKIYIKGQEAVTIDIGFNFSEYLQP